MSQNEDVRVADSSTAAVENIRSEPEKGSAPPRKALKFSTQSKQFVLDEENKIKENGAGNAPNLLEQLRPEHHKVPNAHSMITPSVFHPHVLPMHPQMMSGMIPMGSVLLGQPQPIQLVPQYGMMQPVGMPIPGSMTFAPIQSAGYMPGAQMIAVQSQGIPSQHQQHVGISNIPRAMAAPFVPVGFSGQPQPTEAEDEDEELTLEEMMQALVDNGELNVNPKVRNQIVPGEEAPEEMVMNPDLAAFVSSLTEADYESLMTAYMENCAVKQEHSFGDGSSHHHTYSGIADYKSESSEDEQLPGPTGAENIHQWRDDPEAEARRNEIRKNFYKADCKDCECCKGFAMRCSGPICKSLGLCHCLYRLQCEEMGDDLEQVFIREQEHCTCCKGLVYRCVCVSAQKKDNCHCVS